MPSYFNEIRGLPPYFSGIISKHLPRSIKVKRAYELLGKVLEGSDHLWLNRSAFVALSQHNVPLAVIYLNAHRHQSLRSEENHHRIMQSKLTEHLAESAQHEELDSLIALFSVDAREVLPEISSLSLQEAKQMATELSAARQKIDGIEPKKDSNGDEDSVSFHNELLWLVNEVIFAASHGYGNIFSGVHKFFLAGKSRQGEDIIHATWEKHYRDLGRRAREEEMQNYLQDGMQFTKDLLEKLPDMSRSDVSEHLQQREQLLAKLNKGELTDEETIHHLMGTKILYFADNEYVLLDTKHLLEEISEKYLPALEEIERAKRVLLAVSGLSPRALRRLGRNLQRAKPASD